MISRYDLLKQTPIQLEFLNKELEFKLDPKHFVKWLKLEDWDIDPKDYGRTVSSACEYSCLYIGMLTQGLKLKNPLKIYYGGVGFFEHYWIGQVIDGEEYFIDLTLAQFNHDAPRLAITKAMNQEVAGGYHFLSEGKDLNEYVKEKEGFKFYTNPHTMKKPTIMDFYKNTEPVFNFNMDELIIE